MCLTLLTQFGFSSDFVIIIQSMIDFDTLCSMHRTSPRAPDVRRRRKLAPRRPRKPAVVMVQCNVEQDHSQLTLSCDESDEDEDNWSHSPRAPGPTILDQVEINMRRTHTLEYQVQCVVPMGCTLTPGPVLPQMRDEADFMPDASCHGYRVKIRPCAEILSPSRA